MCHIGQALVEKKYIFSANQKMAVFDNTQISMIFYDILECWFYFGADTNAASR